MRVKQKGYYYVLVAPDDEENMSDSATVEVTLRNVSGAGSKLGYGLVFHSKDRSRFTTKAQRTRSKTFLNPVSVPLSRCVFALCF